MISISDFRIIIITKQCSGCLLSFIKDTMYQQIYKSFDSPSSFIHTTIRIFSNPPKPNPHVSFHALLLQRVFPVCTILPLRSSIPLFPSFLVASIPPIPLIPLPNDNPHSLFHLWQCARRQRTHLPCTGRILHTTDPNGPRDHPSIAK